jgi:hypothetical protein
VKEEDKPRFSESIKLLFVTFGVELDSARMFGYWTALKDTLSIDAFENGIILALEECERFPVPVELKRLGIRWAREKMATRGLPPMSAEEKKKIRESWPDKENDGK